MEAIVAAARREVGYAGDPTENPVDFGNSTFPSTPYAKVFMDHL